MTYTISTEQISAARKPAPARPPEIARTRIPAMNDPARPTAMVCGIDMGSRPGRARRADAPTIRPSTARTMRKAIRLMDAASPRIAWTPPLARRARPVYPFHDADHPSPAARRPRGGDRARRLGGAAAGRAPASPGGDPRPRPDRAVRDRR